MAEDIRTKAPDVVFDELTPEEQGFSDVFETRIKPRLLEDVEKRQRVKAEIRRRLPRFLLISLGSLVIFMTAFFVALVSRGSTIPAMIAAIIAAFVGVGGLFWFMMPTNVAFDSLSRSAAVGLVASRFGLSCDESDASTDLLRESFIQPAGGQEVALGPRLSGKRGTLDLEAWPMVRCTRSGETSQTYFRGWYLRLHLPVNVKSRLVIVEHDAQYDLAGGMKGLWEVTLESAEFARRFHVYSDDQVTARVILSPDVIAHVSDWAPTFKGYGSLIIGVNGDHAELAIPTGENLLERWTPQVPATAVQELHGYFKEIARLLTFVDGFDALVESEGWRGQLPRESV